MSDDKAMTDADVVGDESAPPRSRRDLLRGAAAAAAGGAALLLAKAEPAAAATGGNFILGEDNKASTSTQLEATAAVANGRNVLTVGDGAVGSAFGFVGSQYPAAVGGYAVGGYPSGVANGVFGYSTDTAGGRGVVGLALGTAGTGVFGRRWSSGIDGYGVHGRHDGGGPGVFGESTNGRGVTGYTSSAGTDSAGVLGVNLNGSGITAAGVLGENSGTGQFASGVRGLHRGAGIGVLAQVTGAGTAVFASSPHEGRELHLNNSGRIFQKPQGTAGVPADPAISYEVGDTLRNSRGDIYLCVVDGKPGMWRKVVAGAPEYENRSGSINFLPTPIRIFDTRPAEPAPLPATKQKMVPNQQIVVQVTTTSVGGVSVPPGAVGMIGNLTVTETEGYGFLIAYPTGVAEPLVSSINYLAGDTVANSLTMSLNGVGQLTIKCSGSAAHVIVDVAGFVY